MARPTKQGIDYFPLDVNFDDKIELLIAEKGALALSVLIVAWQLIYQNEGYHIAYNKDLLLLIKRRLMIETDVTNDIIQSAISRGIFNKEIADKYNILTSKAIQKRYLISARLKKEIKIIPEIMLVDVSSIENATYRGVSNVGNDTYKGGNFGGNATNVNVNVNVEEDVKVKEDIKENNNKEIDNNISLKEINDNIIKDNIKTNNVNVPSFDDVIDFAMQSEIPTETAEKFFNYYETQSWQKNNGLPLSNWQVRLKQWYRDELKKEIENEDDKASVKSRLNYKFNPERYKQRYAEIEELVKKHRGGGS